MGYGRNDTFAIEGSTVPVSSYLSTSLDHTLRPFDWYLATVIAGAEFHGLDTAHVAALRGTRFVEDAELGRRTRLDAIEAMREYGIQDYQNLLEGLG